MRSILRKLGASLLLGTLLGGTTESACAQSVAAPPDALPLWEVTDGHGTAYLLGSIHLLRPETYPLHDALYAAFDEADVAVFEVHFDSMTAAAGEMAARGALMGNRSLRDVIGADLYAQLGRELERLGVPPDVMDGQKPWMAALGVGAMALQQAGYDAAKGVDLHFFERAKAAGMEIRGLETLDYQIDVFDGVPEDEQVEFLRATLDDLDGFVEMLDASTELWKRGDIEGLAEEMREGMKATPNLSRRMLDDRNANWVPHIEGLLRAGRTAIVIVGMGHLVGKGSVVDLLRERGHDVEQHTTVVDGAVR